MHQFIITFFCQVLDQRSEVLLSIAQFKGDLFIDTASENLVFSLPALHQFLANRHDLPYAEFKRLLYRGEFNKTLAGSGAKVSLFRSSGKIDSSLYQLVPLALTQQKQDESA